jgi:uncharacterized Zn finger protein
LSETTEPHEPKCPSCAVVGIDTIVSTPSAERSRTKQPWFYIVHCARCGHVYNTIAKHHFTQAVTPNFVLPD